MEKKSKGIKYCSECDGKNCPISNDESRNRSKEDEKRIFAKKSKST